MSRLKICAVIIQINKYIYQEYKEALFTHVSLYYSYIAVGTFQTSIKEALNSMLLTHLCELLTQYCNRYSGYDQTVRGHFLSLENIVVASLNNNKHCKVKFNDKDWTVNVSCAHWLISGRANYWTTIIESRLQTRSLKSEK